MRFVNILAYMPRSEDDAEVLMTAVEAAKRHGARLKLIDIFDELPREMFRNVTAMHLENLRQLAGGEREEELAKMSETLADVVDIEVGFHWGRPSIEITREVIRAGHDLVVMPAEADQELGLGHVEIRVARHCPAPVWVVRPGLRRQAPRVLVAVDSFVYDDHRIEMNHKLLRVAQAFVETFDAEVHVLHVWRSVTGGAWSIPHGYASADLNRFLVDARDRHRESLESLLAAGKLRIPNDRAHLLEGDTADAIAECIRKHDIDLLIMGSLHSLEIPGYFIGSTAEKILRRVTCSVVTVKPDDFISPIRPESEDMRGQAV